MQESAKLHERPYGRWIAAYSDPAFRQLADQLEQLLDQAAANTSEIRLTYRYAMQCELDFFSDAFRGPAEPETGLSSNGPNTQSAYSR